jgi:DNA-directed RNA polymerase subunit RPC12/RpoP
VEARKKEKRRLKTLCAQEGDIPPVIRTAYCFSEECDLSTGCTTGVIIENVPVYTIDCPKCGHAIWWKMRVDYDSIEKKKK